MFTVTKVHDFWKANVDFAHKDMAKGIGFKWNPNLKCWYTHSEILANIIESGFMVINGINVVLRHSEPKKIAWFQISSEGLEGSTPEDKGDNYYRIFGAGFLFDPKKKVWHARHVSALVELMRMNLDNAHSSVRHKLYMHNIKAELSGLYEAIVDSRDGADGSDLTQIYERIDEIKQILFAYGEK